MSRLVGVALLLALSAVQYQHMSPTPAAGEADHHGCLEQQRAAIERAEAYHAENPVVS